MVVPAYNEGNRIAATVGTIRAFLESLDRPFEIIVVDDGSLDNTREASAAIEGVKAISYKLNRGKGYAVRQGMIASEGELVAFTDVDLSAPIEELAKLIIAVETGADVAIGSRAMKGSKLEIHQPLYREIGGKTLNLLIRLFAVQGIHDTQCGFKLFRGDAAREMFPKCIVDGWGFDIEVLRLARKIGCVVAEIPVRWSHSADSRIHPFKAGLQVLRDILRIRLHRY